MVIFGFWAKNGAKIGVIGKDLHFSSEFHALSGGSFGIPKLNFEYIFDSFQPIQGEDYLHMPWKKVQ